MFESSELVNNCSIKPVQFHFDLKSSNISSDIRTTRDSEIKIDTGAKPTRKSSLTGSSPSKEKEKKLLIGNFLYLFNYLATSTLMALKT